MSANRRGERPDCWRGGSIVHRLGSTEVNRFNQGLAATGLALPKISDVIVVLNVVLEECYLVFLHQVNRRAAAATRVGQLLKLSERRIAPHRGRELWLRTPAYYRRIESPHTKPTDSHDGFLTKDATPWMRQALALKVGPIESLNATMTFASHQEPWVYCTSTPPTNEAEWKELRDRFPEYDAMTAIRDPSSFAVQLGIDFAFSVQESTHVDLSPIEKRADDQSSYTVPLWKGSITLTRSSVCTMAQWSTRTSPASWDRWRTLSIPRWFRKAGSQRRRGSLESANTVLPCPLSETARGHLQAANIRRIENAHCQGVTDTPAPVTPLPEAPSSEGTQSPESIQLDIVDRCRQDGFHRLFLRVHQLSQFLLEFPPALPLLELPHRKTGNQPSGDARDDSPMTRLTKRPMRARLVRSTLPSTPVTGFWLPCLRDSSR